MSDDPNKKDQDQKLFQETMQDAAPLVQDRIKPWRRRLPPHPLRHPTTLEDETGSDHISEAEIETGEVLSFCRPGLQKRVFRDLRRGRMEIEMELDLHGLTARHAHSTLELFFRDCHRRRIRCVHIIHGKGYGSEDRQPVLKQKLNLWLRQRHDVMAFCSATARDGGTGAAYVLLRSKG
ncbi:MAG: DNA mismatch repair protein MutS [Gammaproteobacteria bacterium]|nr:DNA mismatch repair protein MutS [Gammaproteobacteria bacterium]